MHWGTRTPLGQALFTIVSAEAQLERDIIRERVNAGICNARSNGTKFGRTAVNVNCAQILELRAQGHSLQQIWESVMAQFVLDFKIH